jgi:hypothetical protein
VDPDDICAGPDRIDARGGGSDVQRVEILITHTERSPHESLAARPYDHRSIEPNTEVAAVP